jgi:hypothetical protein
MPDTWTDGQMQTLEMAVRLQALTSELRHFTDKVHGHEAAMSRQAADLKRLTYAVHEQQAALRYLDLHLTATTPAPWWRDLHSWAPLVMWLLAALALILKATGHAGAASALSGLLTQNAP